MSKQNKIISTLCVLVFLLIAPFIIYTRIHNNNQSLILNLLPPGDGANWGAVSEFEDQRVFKVISHGIPSHINKWTFIDIAEFVKNNEYFQQQIKNSKPIIIDLMACEVGRDDINGISLHLSKEIKNYYPDVDVYVIAPTRSLWNFAFYNFQRPYEDLRLRIIDMESSWSFPNFFAAGHYNIFKNGKLWSQYEEMHQREQIYQLGKIEDL